MSLFNAAVIRAGFIRITTIGQETHLMIRRLIWRYSTGAPELLDRSLSKSNAFSIIIVHKPKEAPVVSISHWEQPT